MDFRGVLLIGAVLGAGTLASTPACSGPDPGSLTFVERPSSGPGEPQPGTSSSGSTGGAPGSTSGTPGDGGGTRDAGDPVFGNAAFTHVDPGVAANGANAQHAGTVEGKDCIVAGCHLDGGERWVFGGTLYTTAQGGTVARGEIKIVGPNGAEIGTTYTDANGNFWLEKPATTIPQGSMVAVRREGGPAPKRMLTALAPTDAGCSKAGTCHGGSQGRVYTD